MKTLIFLSSYLLLAAQHILSQNPKEIALSASTYNGTEKFNFRGFRVIDARQDSGKVGYFGYGKLKPRQLTFRNGTSAAVSSFLSDYYKHCFTASAYSVLLVIKKLWISQFDSSLSFETTSLSGRVIKEKIKFEFYLENGQNYFPIMRVDTSFLTGQGRSAKALENEIEDGIINSCDKLFSIDINRILQRKSVSYSWIAQFNRQLSEKPILQANEYKKGVFMTFEEFLNNQPSAQYTGISREAFSDVLYLKDENGEYPTTKFWAYSDGKDLYISSGKNFFLLKRVQNTFEFYGIKYLKLQQMVTPLYDPRLGTGGFALTNDQMNMFTYQVDMETGEVY